MDLSSTYHWDFGDSSIADATVEDQAEVRFNNSGTYTVTFTRSPTAEGCWIRHLMRCGFNPISPRFQSPQSSWGLIYVDSQEVVGEGGVNAFDGDPATIWHTEWKYSKPAHPHEIQIDLGETYELEKFHYLLRQGDNVNGRIKDYQLYVSEKLGHSGCSGSFPNTANEQIVLFSSLPIWTLPSSVARRSQRPTIYLYRKSISWGGFLTVTCRREGRSTTRHKT